MKIFNTYSAVFYSLITIVFYIISYWGLQNSEHFGYAFNERQ